MPPSENHSRFGMSGIDRWLHCHGSVWYQFSNSAGPAAAEGSAAHTLNEDCAKNNKRPDTGLIGQKVPGTDIEITQEMIDGTNLYLDHIKALQESLPRGTFSVEERVDMDAFKEMYLTDYSEELPNIFSTLDAAIDDRYNELVIIDYKYGRGISVPADCLQLRGYAAMRAGRRLRTYVRVRTVIIQPRDKYGKTYKEHIYKPSEIIEWMQDDVLPAINDAMSSAPSFKPSKEACRWCDISGHCVHQLDGHDVMPIPDLEMVKTVDPNLLSVHELADIISRIDVVEDFFKKARIKATNLALSGVEIPGYKLGEGWTKRAWKPDVDIGKVLYKEIKLKKKDIYEERLRTPKQILSVTPKLKQPAVEKLIYKPKGQPKLVPVEDPREEFDPLQSAADDFSNL